MPLSIPRDADLHTSHALSAAELEIAAAYRKLYGTEATAAFIRENALRLIAERTAEAAR